MEQVLDRFHVLPALVMVLLENINKCNALGTVLFANSARLQRRRLACPRTVPYANRTVPYANRTVPNANRTVPNAVNS